MKRPKSRTKASSRRVGKGRARKSSGPSGSHSLQDLLLDNLSEGVVTCDEKGRFTVFNRAAERILGRGATDATMEVWGSRYGVFRPDGKVPFPTEEFPLARALRGENTDNQEQFIRNPKNPQGLMIRVTGRPLRDAKGRVTGGLAVFRDVTEVKKAVAKFQGILEAAPDAMVIVDREGRMILVNAQAEALFGHRREELLGEPIEILIPERFRPSHPGNRGGYLASPKVRPMGAGLDLYALRKDGTEFPAEISLSPVETSDGLFVTAAIRDVSERKRHMEEENRRVAEANRLKSEFLANMSHELRTPLNAIIGFSELMYYGKAGPLPEEHKEYLGDILTSARHLLQLINDVLDLTKIEAGKMEFRPEALDLDQAVQEVKGILRGLASPKGIAVEAEVDPAVGRVVLDGSKFKQVLYNYLSNALKFTPEGGKVSVRVLPEGDAMFRLEVKDTGIGIDPKDLHKLFIEFVQLDSGSAKKQAGTGLGLALTKRIVEAQGGKVGVKSEPGKGSAFWATFPREMAK